MVRTVNHLQRKNRSSVCLINFRYSLKKGGNIKYSPRFYSHLSAYSMIGLSIASTSTHSATPAQAANSQAAAKQEATSDKLSKVSPAWIASSAHAVLTMVAIKTVNAIFFECMLTSL